MTLASLSPQAALPSPATAVWQIGPIPLRAYALCILLGIVVAMVVTETRLRRRGVAPGAVLDIALWAVPTGIVGARLYHVITSPQAYFGADGHPLDAFKVWEGGLGIWGGVAGGALGAWLAARQLGLPLSVVADALAPGLPLAQAVGRFGNWFNNELYGGQTTLPWGLEVHKMDPQRPGHALLDPDGKPVLLPGHYHPTFAYEAIWDGGVALLVYLVDRRLKLGRGRAFALYVMGYTLGRFWIELMRTDQANHILGLRLNVWTALLVFVGGLIYFVRIRGQREYVVPDSGLAGVVPAPGEPTSDVSQVDVSRTATTAPPPGGYRVVDEERYLAFQRTGELPAAAEPGTAEPGAEPTGADDAPGAQRPDGGPGEPVGAPSAAGDEAGPEGDASAAGEDGGRAGAVAPGTTDRDV